MTGAISKGLRCPKYSRPGSVRRSPFRETATDYLRRSGVAPIRRHVPPELDPLKVALDEYNEITATLRTDGLTQALPGHAAEHFFTLGFGLERPHRNFRDVARCVSSTKIADIASPTPDGSHSVTASGAASVPNSVREKSLLYQLKLLYPSAPVGLSDIYVSLGIDGQRVGVGKFAKLMARTTEAREDFATGAIENLHLLVATVCHVHVFLLAV
jgi:hypothetical protein